jgi:uncharacterized membrane protein
VPRGQVVASRRPVVLVLVALAGCLVSSYLAAFQLGLVPQAWDPIFGDGSDRVLTSTVSRLLPVPDASIGAGAYAIDAVLGIALAARGDAPGWIAALLALVASVGAAVALVLVVLQPLVARSFCSLCLVSAGLSVGLAVGAVSGARDRLIPRRPTAADSQEGST